MQSALERFLEVFKSSSSYSTLHFGGSELIGFAEVMLLVAAVFVPTTYYIFGETISVVVNADSGLSLLISGLLGILACFIQIILNITDLTAVGQIITDCWSSFASLLGGLASLASLVALKLSWWQKAFFWTTFYGDQAVTQNILGIVGRLALAVIVLAAAITKFVNVYEDSLDSDSTYYLWEYSYGGGSSE